MKSDAFDESHRDYSKMGLDELADRLGIAKAAVALAAEDEKAIADELKRRMPSGGSAIGVIYGAALSLVPGRESWDGEWLRAHLHPNSLRRAIKIGDPFMRITVSARRREAA